MADYTQSVVSVLAHQNVALGANAVGDSVDVSTYLGGVLYLRQANIGTTANLVAGSDYIDVQVSPDDDDNNWHSFLRLIPNATASATTTIAGDEAIGETVLAFTSGASFSAGEYIYIKDDTDVASSEWNEVVAVATNDVTVLNPIVVAKVANDDVYDNASRWSVFMDFAGIKRLRVVVVHQGATGSDWRVEATLCAATDIE